MKLYLASTSKYKSNILNQVHLKHTCLSCLYVEDSQQTNVYEYVKELSLGKAKSVLNQIESGLVIGLDTVVYINDQIIEKPKSKAEAKNNLKICSDYPCLVITGIAVINVNTNEIVSTFAETKVTMNKISENDLEYYIKNEKDVMNVSGFIIENIASNFIDKIEGSYYNILGIPVESIYKIINKMGYDLSDIK